MANKTHKTFKARKGHELFSSFLLLLLGIIKSDVATLTCADANGILYRYDKDAAITDLACLRSLENGIHSLLNILVTNHERHKSALYGTGVIHHSTVNASLAHLALSTHIIVGKPLDVSSKQGFFYILKTRLADNGFNLLHAFFSFYYIITSNAYFLSIDRCKITTLCH